MSVVVSFMQCACRRCNGIEHSHIALCDLLEVLGDVHVGVATV